MRPNTPFQLGKRHGQPHGGSQKPPKAQKVGNHPKGPKRPSGGRNAAQTSITAPLDPKTFRREVRSSVRLQTRPLERQLQSEFQGSVNRQQAEIPAWFGDYLQKVQGSAQNTQNAYNQVNANFGNYLQNANTSDTAARDKVNQQAQADAAQRGANVSSVAADQAANASARRADLGAFQGGVLGTQGANAYAYLQNRGAIAGREQIDQQQQEALNRRKISSDQRELAQKKGDIANQTRQDLRKAERDYKIQRMAFTKPTANQALSSATSRRNANLSSATTRRGQNMTQQTSLLGNAASLKKQKQKERWDKAHPGASGSSGGRSPAEKHSDRQAFHNAYSAVSAAYHSAATKPKTDTQWQQLSSAVVNGVTDSQGNPIVKGLGGTNPHLWTSKAIKRFQKKINKPQGPPPGGGQGHSHR